MRKQFIKASTMLALIVAVAFVSAATSAYGQMSGRNMRANIPFDFSVGDKALQAGEYTVRSVTTSDTGLVISSVNGNGNKMFLTNSVQAANSSDKARLIFRKYGNRYYLAQVFPSGNAGRELVKSRGERRIERELAKNTFEDQQPETVVVIARWQ